MKQRLLGLVTRREQNTKGESLWTMLSTHFCSRGSVGLLQSRSMTWEETKKSYTLNTKGNIHKLVSILFSVQ